MFHLRPNCMDRAAAERFGPLPEMGLMARRSPDPDGETIIVPRPGLAVIEFHVIYRRTVLEIRGEPMRVERIAYRTDRQGD